MTKYQLLILDMDVESETLAEKEYRFPVQNHSSFACEEAGAGWLKRFPNDIAMVVEVDQPKPYEANGDMIATTGQRFRQVGWQINGGEDNGSLIEMGDPALEVILSKPHGGYSPVYVEVGE